MNMRTFLKISTASLMLGGLVAASYPFLSAMSISANARNNDLAVIDLPKLNLGEIVRISVEGKQLIILKPDEKQQESIQILNDHVWNPESLAYKPAIGAYVYWAESTRWGCPLEHEPPQESRIREWDKNAVWLGGYWDWQCEVSYDYAGRSIKSYMYTFNGYSGELPNLASPKVFKKSNGKYVVSLRQR